METLPEDLQEGSWRFSKWRAERSEKSGSRKIPKELWNLAIAMTAKYSVGEVAFALKINSAILKSKVEEAKIREMEAESARQMSVPHPSAFLSVGEYDEEDELEIETPLRFAAVNFKNETKHPKIDSTITIAEAISTTGNLIRIFSGVTVEDIKLLALLVREV